MKALILGSGFTASYLHEYIVSKEPHAKIWHSSRKPGKDIIFEWEREESWEEIPEVDVCFWLFPLPSPNDVDDFFDRVGHRLGKIVLCSSTGFFKQEFDEQKINEESDLDFDKPRALAEEKLRQKGAVIVHAAGIYGSRRNPADWLRSGRVRPSDRFVNLIHVQDLAQFLYQASKIANPSERFIASDGKPMRWKEISERLEKEFGFEFDTQVSEETSRLSKLIQNEKSRKRLQIRLQYPDVIWGIRSLLVST